MTLHEWVEEQERAMKIDLAEATYYSNRGQHFMANTCAAAAASRFNQIHEADDSEPRTQAEIVNSTFASVMGHFGGGA